MSQFKEFAHLKMLVFDSCNLHCSVPIIEKESAAYGACHFKLDSLNIRFRVAKITPTKIGQFVTLWKRSKDGITEPFNTNDEIDYFIITAKSAEQFGFFIFPKRVLINHFIISSNGINGKRGIRVYPSWDRVNSKQAQKTQDWQVQYFINLLDEQAIDYEKIKQLLA